MQHLEHVPLATSYHLNVFRLPKVWSMLHHVSMGRVQNKNAIICLYLLIRLFLLFFVIKLVFFSLLLFLTKFKFPQQNIDLSETGIRDQNLSVELYALLDCRIVVIVLDIIKYFILSLLNIKS